MNHFLQINISTNVVIVVAGRDSIEQSTPADPKRWLTFRDNDVIYFINLNSFTEEETRTYLATRGITDPASVATIWQLSRGLPLYWGFLTFNLHGDVDPTAGVVANFLRWIPEQEHIKRRLALDAALFSKPFNQDDLAAFKYVPESERIDLYHWLIKLPFVRSNLQDGRYRYHDLAQEMFRRHQFRDNKREYYVTIRELAVHYRLQIEEMQKERGKKVYHSTEWLEVNLALAYQLFILPDEASLVDGVEQILRAYNNASKEQGGEIVRFLRDLSLEQPNKQVSIESLLLVKQLLQYIEAVMEDQHQKVVETSSDLLKRLDSYPAFSLELLVRLYRNRGIAYKNLKEYQRAIEDYDRAIELDPTYLYAHNSRGIAYKNLKEYQRAIEDYDRAIELDPTYVAAYNGRGNAYTDLKEYQHAIEDYDRAIELDPDLPQTYYARGFAYTWLKDIGNAITNFSQCSELDSSNIPARWAVEWLGMCLEKDDLGRIERLEKIAASNPTDDIACTCQGVAFWLGGNFEKALLELDQAIHLNPEVGGAYFWKAMAYSSLRRDEEAIAALKKAIKVDFPVPPILLTLLDWLVEERHDFYKQFALPLIENSLQTKS